MPRPSLKPTEEQHRQVKTMARMGIRQEAIALVMDIRSLKTLRKYFRRELDVGDTLAYFGMEQAQYESGRRGNVYAQANWLSRHRRRHESAFQPAATPPPFIVYEDKKVQAHQDNEVKVHPENQVEVQQDDERLPL